MKSLLQGSTIALGVALSALLFGCSSNGGSDCALSDVAGERCAELEAMALPESLPEARGNRYANDDGATMLGFHLFFDVKLGNGITCAACHAPELAFTDRVPVSIGKGTGNRNAPTVFNAARLHSFFWDGSADSLWSQPLFAIESPVEMASSRLALAHLIAGDDDHRGNYERAFGPLPDMSEWPQSGRPGDPAFDQLSAEVKDQVNRVAANAGKAFEAYQRKNTTGNAPFDLYVGGDRTQLIPAAERGLTAFLKAGCTTCHSGPMLTDEAYHDVGFPSRPGAAPDAGRLGGLAILEDNPFNLHGPFADPGVGLPTGNPAPESISGTEFRTPSLRNVSRTAPYGHDGALSTLMEVLKVHAPMLSETEAGEVRAFLETLNGVYPPRPWNNWPSPQ